MNQRQTTCSTSLPLLLCVLGVSGCSESAPPPRSAIFFEGDPVALEAKLIDCQADARLSSDDPECRNARIAANRIAAAEELLRKARLEAESERKRQQLRERRMRDAEAAARRGQALRAEAEAKLDRGEFLTVEEAEALGVDPTNPALVRQPADDGRDASTAPNAHAAPGATLELTPLEPVDAPGDTEAGGGAGAVVGGERPRDLSEIREALEQEDDSGDDDGDPGR